MKNENFIRGNNEAEVWQQITGQFDQNPDPLEYSAVIQQGNYQVSLIIDIDLGGGFESGYETTSFTAPLADLSGFRFAIHEEHFTDEIGKFFGMQDVVIGFNEFDKRLIIKTNDQRKVRSVFADAATRAVFETLENFTFAITTHHAGDGGEIKSFLELVIETGITDPNKLRILYGAFFSVLIAMNSLS